MSTRADFLAVLLGNSRRMDAERRELANDIRLELADATRHGRFDYSAYVAASVGIDRAFDRFYGRFPDDRSAPLRALIVDERRKAKAVPIRQAVADVNQRLRGHPEVLRTIRKEAAHG